MNALTLVDPCLCPLCGQPNSCVMVSPGDSPAQPCWCTRVHFDRELLLKVPEAARNKACICRACASRCASIDRD